MCLVCSRVYLFIPDSLFIPSHPPGLFDGGAACWVYLEHVCGNFMEILLWASRWASTPSPARGLLHPVPGRCQHLCPDAKAMVTRMEPLPSAHLLCAASFWSPGTVTGTYRWLWVGDEGAGGLSGGEPRCVLRGSIHSQFYRLSIDSVPMAGRVPLVSNPVTDWS